MRSNLVEKFRKWKVEKVLNNSASGGLIRLNLQVRKLLVHADTTRIDSPIAIQEADQVMSDLVLADGYALDYNHALLLKSKIKCGFKKLTELFVRKSICIDSGPEHSLTILQNELKEIGIITKVVPHR